MTACDLEQPVENTMKNSLNSYLKGSQLVAIAVMLFAVSIVGASETVLPKCQQDIEPTVRVAPIYPADIRIAASEEEARHVRWVVVEFTILETGRTADLLVVESNSVLFHRSAKRAISEYHYGPQESACIHRDRVTYLVK